MVFYSIQEYHQWVNQLYAEFKHSAGRAYKTNLRRLQEAGTLRFIYKRPKTLKQKRSSFSKGKQEFGRCKCCGRFKYLVRHHMIWLSRGGMNNKNNIVKICQLCHAELHPWLKTKLPPTEQAYLCATLSPSPHLDLLFGNGSENQRRLVQAVGV